MEAWAPVSDPSQGQDSGCWACPHTPRCAQVCSGVLAGPRCRVGCEAIHSGLSGGLHLWGPPCRSPRQKWDVRFVHDGQAGFHGRTEMPDDLPVAGDWTPLAATCPISPAGPRRCFWSQKLGARTPRASAEAASQAWSSRLLPSHFLFLSRIWCFAPWTCVL